MYYEAVILSWERVHQDSKKHFLHITLCILKLIALLPLRSFNPKTSEEPSFDDRDVITCQSYASCLDAYQYPLSFRPRVGPGLRAIVDQKCIPRQSTSRALYDSSPRVKGRRLSCLQASRRNKWREDSDWYQINDVLYRESCLFRS